MDGNLRGVVTTVADRPREGWDDPHRGAVSWYTLFSSDISPTDWMTAGIAELPPGGGALRPHAHDQAEIYYIVEGRGMLWLNGAESEVEAGAAVFIPGGMPHGLRNHTDSVVRLFYVFPTGRFSDIVYRFDAK